MTIEERLRNLIIEKYGSVRNFTEKAGIVYTSMFTIFERGVMNASIRNIITICNELNISADELAKGRIVYTDGEEEFVSLENCLLKIKTAMEEDMLSYKGTRLTEEEKLYFSGALAVCSGMLDETRKKVG